MAEVGATQRAEIASDDPLQRWWRPIYALELSLVECPAFALTLLHALWIGHDAGINGFANLSALLMAYFGARFGVLGVYVTGRTQGKAGQRDRGTAANPDRRIAQGARDEQEEVMSRSSDIHRLDF